MKKINTLVFAGGAIHDWKGCSQEIVKSLSKTDDFEITVIEDDLDALVAPKLDPYDLIVFYYTVGEISDAQKKRFTEPYFFWERICWRTFSC